MATPDLSENNSYPFLAGGAEMGELIRSFNWRETPLGLPQTWPAALRYSVSMMLSSAFPILICWGSEYTQLYNDHFKPINGEKKHPGALGGTARDTYAEIWDKIGPMFEGVMQGQTFGFPNFMVSLDRDGYPEECYFDFSYGPIRNEDGTIGGILVICVETTDKVVVNKRLKENNFELTQAVKAEYYMRRKAEESEERFRNMAENTDVMIAVADETSNAVYFNKAWTEFTGRSMEQLLEYGWADLIHPDDKGDYLNMYLSAFKHRIPFTGELRILDKNGDYRWLLSKGPPRFHPDGTFSGYISSCIDITASKMEEMRKNDFIGIVSHELKTPLTSLTAIIQLLALKLKGHDNDFVAGAMDKANTQVKKMKNLINGFLNMSRVESGKLHLEMQEFDLNVLIAELIADEELTVTSHQFVFFPQGLISVVADRDKIASVITNLLSNSVKYSPKGQQIFVDCVLLDEGVQVSIADQGMGIKEQDLDKLFDRYYRVDNKHTKNISGFGIGLYLSAEIVKRHEGRIWVESESGKGSVFRFTLPVNG